MPAKRAQLQLQSAGWSPDSASVGWSAREANGNEIVGSYSPATGHARRLLELKTPADFVAADIIWVANDGRRLLAQFTDRICLIRAGAGRCYGGYDAEGAVNPAGTLYADFSGNQIQVLDLASGQTVQRVADDPSDSGLNASSSIPFWTSDSTVAWAVSLPRHPFTEYSLDVQSGRVALDGTFPTLATGWVRFMTALPDGSRLGWSQGYAVHMTHSSVVTARRGKQRHRRTVPGRLLHVWTSRGGLVVPAGDGMSAAYATGRAVWREGGRHIPLQHVGGPLHAFGANASRFLYLSGKNQSFGGLALHLVDLETGRDTVLLNGGSKLGWRYLFRHTKSLGSGGVPVGPAQAPGPPGKRPAPPPPPHATLGH